MTPLPKKKHSTQRKGKRRRAIARPTANLSVCRHCGAPKEPHVVCQNCQKY